MKKEMNIKRTISSIRYLIFEKEFNGPSLGVLGLMLIPLIAYPQTLTDYENTATVEASTDQFETDDTNNSSTVSVIPNAEIVIIKRVIEDNGGSSLISDFNITTSAGALSFDAGSTSGDVTTYTSATLYVAPGTYSLIEGDVPGYTPGDWLCTAGVVGADVYNAGEITLTAGEATECTIINDDIEPQLTLTKNVVNDHGGTNGPDDFGLAIVYGTTNLTPLSGDAQAVPANTTITISEVVDSGYAAGNWECTDAAGAPVSLAGGGLAAGDTLELLPGAVVNCAITNDDIEPTLTLVKNVVNDHGGLLAAIDFDLTIEVGGVSTTVGSALPEPVPANTIITISEEIVDGYAEGTWACTDAGGANIVLAGGGLAGGDTLELLPGTNATCSITNDDIQPTLTLVKNVINDNGGDKDATDFGLVIGTTPPQNPADSGTAYPVTANTAITISELDLTDYAEGTWVCTDASGFTDALNLPGSGAPDAFDSAEVTLAPGAVVTCEITNDDLGIDLRIDKMVSNGTPNIGDTITFTLTVRNDGPDIATNATVTDIVQPGFSYVVGSIAGGTSTNEIDPAGVGLKWMLGTVPVNTDVVLTFDVTVNAP